MTSRVVTHRTRRCLAHHHVGIYLGNGRVIHAPHTGDVVKISDLDMDPSVGAVRVTAHAVGNCPSTP